MKVNEKLSFLFAKGAALGAVSQPGKEAPIANGLPPAHTMG